MDALIEYQEPVLIHLFPQYSEEDKGARGYQGDESQWRQTQAIYVHKILWLASLTHQPFQKSVY